MKLSVTRIRSNNIWTGRSGIGGRAYEKNVVRISCRCMPAVMYAVLALNYDPHNFFLLIEREEIFNVLIIVSGKIRFYRGNKPK